jgi:hypothetical protein
MYLAFRNSPSLFNDLYGMAVTVEECKSMAAKPAEAGEQTVQILADIKANGCLLPSLICTCQKDNVYAAIYEPIPKNTITIYICNIKDAQALKATFLHEVTHAWQYCRNKDLKNDCPSQVCAEIQAYTTDGECAAKFPTNAVALKDCIVNKAAGSALRPCGGDKKTALQKAGELYNQCSKKPLTKVV